MLRLKGKDCDVAGDVDVEEHDSKVGSNSAVVIIVTMVMMLWRCW